MNRIVLLSFTLSFLAILLISNYSDAEIVLLMKFDEGSGNSVTDSSGQGNNGKVAGKVEWVKGKFDRALKFDGATTHITIPKTPSLSQLSETMSVGVWIKPVSLSGWTNIVEVDGAVNKAWKVGFRNANPVFTIYGVQDYIGTGSIKTGEWSHLAYTYDGKVARIYINGVLDSQIASSRKADPSLNIRLRFKRTLIGFLRGDVPSLDIGWRGIAKSFYLNAFLDELWVSTDVMSAEEIQKLIEGREKLTK